MEELGPLRIRARERMTQGRLPRTKAIRTWGGPGSGAICSLCDAAILASEPEFEVQFDLSAPSSSLRFHRQCHSIWNELREESRPPEWCLVSEQLPPPGVVVEARVRLGATRTIILNLICSPGAAAEGARTWINGTTGDPLPEGWNAIEWRQPSALRSDSGRPAEPREPTVDPRAPSVTRRA